MAGRYLLTGMLGVEKCRAAVNRPRQDAKRVLFPIKKRAAMEISTAARVFQIQFLYSSVA
jgi:hypothetical protein